MISTFNFWLPVMVLTLLVAVAIAYYSINDDILKAEKRISDRAWRVGTFIYFIAVSIILARMFIAESLLGMIEQLGGDRIKGVGDLARNLFWIIAIAWAIFVCLVATFIRDRRAKHAGLTDSRTRSKRRHRQKQTSLGKPQIVNFKEASAARAASSVQKKTPTQVKSSSPVDDQQHIIEKRVLQAIDNYTIEKLDSTDLVYTDEQGGKRPVTDYIPAGVHECFVAIRRDGKDETPIFLGFETKEVAREILERYLREKIQARVRSGRTKDIAVANQ